MSGKRALSKRVTLSLLSLLLLTSMFTCAFAATYEYLDLSNTQNTYTIHQTGSIVVKGVSAAGKKAAVASGVIFQTVSVCPRFSGGQELRFAKETPA